MIRSITSDLPTFKALNFQRGLNILLADKSVGSSEGHTRNSAGKSSFVEIVQFLLGANADKDSLVRHPALEGYSFTGEFLIGGNKLKSPAVALMQGKYSLMRGMPPSLGLTPKEQRTVSFTSQMTPGSPP